MTKEFKKGDWVKINWKGVYPEWVGHVKNCREKETSVIFPRFGTIDIPTDKLTKTNEPKAS